MFTTYVYSTVFLLISVSVFYVWPKTTSILPMWPWEAKRLDTPGLDLD